MMLMEMFRVEAAKCGSVQAGRIGPGVPRGRPSHGEERSPRIPEYCPLRDGERGERCTKWGCVIFTNFTGNEA